MTNLNLYAQVSLSCSQAVTKAYSTSFFSAISLLNERLRNPVYAVYGFVRVCDEIVDSFHGFDKQTLLAEFKEQTDLALSRKISSNPILQSFQNVVHTYGIGYELIESFFHSMQLDLDKSSYSSSEALREYIYGSAEVVGLMCLHIFCLGDLKLYDELKSSAQTLGSAFQKVNFLRDVQDDVTELNRVYFPSFSVDSFDKISKSAIEADIQSDFDVAINGIRKLPAESRFGVYLAYRYYLSLFKKIRSLEPAALMASRVRINNSFKLAIMIKAGLKSKLNLI